MTRHRRRLEAPWRVEKTPGGWRVLTANGISVCFVYERDEKTYGSDWSALDPDEARRIAKGIARLPELMAASTRVG